MKKININEVIKWLVAIILLFVVVALAIHTVKYLTGNYEGHKKYGKHENYKKSGSWEKSSIEDKKK